LDRKATGENVWVTAEDQAAFKVELLEAAPGVGITQARTLGQAGLASP